MATDDEINAAIARDAGWEFVPGKAGRDGLGPLYSSHWRRGSERRSTMQFTHEPALIVDLLCQYEVTLETYGSGSRSSAWVVDEDRRQEGGTPMQAVARAVFAFIQEQTDER